MHQQLQRNFDVIQYLVKNASSEQLTWRKNHNSWSLADVLGQLRDVERWNASIHFSDVSGDHFSLHQTVDQDLGRR